MATGRACREMRNNRKLGGAVGENLGGRALPSLRATRCCAGGDIARAPVGSATQSDHELESSFAQLTCAYPNRINSYP